MVVGWAEIVSVVGQSLPVITGNDAGAYSFKCCFALLKRSLMLVQVALAEPSVTQVQPICSHSFTTERFSPSWLEMVLEGPRMPEP